MCAPARSQIIEDNASKQTSYGCIFLKKTSVAAINITLGVPGQRADKRKSCASQKEFGLGKGERWGAAGSSIANFVSCQSISFGVLWRLVITTPRSQNNNNKHTD